ncbi:hypothetical protein CPAR01_04358 [Colletotrichum paranaense]|uniref:BTB domain-containing protein n=1 Tax=Colletotrichum paranaense TaxID=1914294 RepID=A0ABQ9SWJ2_9PEZI|nr:uncharacterized protein CPAR01_04358 [Colletotrichum paranaense]KAK1543725.1 hypothetical protein CPAR01_04358 [Colletotrichum paranaense]
MEPLKATPSRVPYSLAQRRGRLPSHSTAASFNRGVPDLEGVLTSRVVTFRIGPDRKPFQIHEKLVASRSVIFDRMLANNMRESLEGVVDIEDVEPEPDNAKLIPGETYDSLLEHVLKYDFGLSKKQPYLRYLTLFINQGTPGKLYGMPPGFPWNKDEELEANFDLMVANRLFGEICMHHVQLYILADRYDIAQLRQVSLHRLHSSLTRARLSDAGYQLLFGVIEFAFTNTMPGDKIRKLLIQTCVADFSMVRAMPSFTDLLHRVPELGVEIMTELPTYWEERKKAINDVNAKFASAQSDATTSKEKS